MKINVENGVTALDIEKQTPYRINKYMTQLKKSLGVDWIGLCPVFGLTATRGNCNNMSNWRSGAKIMPNSSWVLLLVLTKTDAIEINKADELEINADS